MDLLKFLAALLTPGDPDEDVAQYVNAIIKSNHRDVRTDNLGGIRVLCRLGLILLRYCIIFWCFKEKYTGLCRSEGFLEVINFNLPYLSMRACLRPL